MATSSIFIYQSIYRYKVKTIVDIGQVVGFIKKNQEENNKIKLIGIDSDSKTIKYLKNYNIEIFLMLIHILINIK